VNVWTIEECAGKLCENTFINVNCQQMPKETCYVYHNSKWYIAWPSEISGLECNVILHVLVAEALDFIMYFLRFQT
jgi:hypothetical protein